MTTVLPGAGLEVEDDLVDGKRVYPVGGLFFGAKGALSRVTSTNPMPVRFSEAQEISGEVTATLSDPPTSMQTTRLYNFGAAVYAAFAATSSAAVALPALGDSREVRLNPSARCWIRFGTSGVTAAAAGAASFPVEPGVAEVIPVPADATHFRVIRDTVDGNLHMLPVA